jgi:hypothetical protein
LGPRPGALLHALRGEAVEHKDHCGAEQYILQQDRRKPRAPAKAPRYQSCDEEPAEEDAGLPGGPADHLGRAILQIQCAGRATGGVADELTRPAEPVGGPAEPVGGPAAGTQPVISPQTHHRRAEPTAGSRRHLQLAAASNEQPEPWPAAECAPPRAAETHQLRAGDRAPDDRPVPSRLW